MTTQAPSFPGLRTTLIGFKCPCCGKTPMFTSRNPYHLKSVLDMPASCPECGLSFEPEIGFYFGTGYVSYALCFGMSVVFFLAWWLLAGFSLHDNSLFYWLGADVFLLIVLQPIIMRLSRVIWLMIFVRSGRVSPHRKV